jgi:hypothetical protein
MCRDISGVPYLLGDFTLRCYDSSWYTWEGFAISMVMVYPVGVPCFFLALLLRYRTRLSEVGVRVQLGFLYAGYSDAAWWFELVDMAFKLTLTSILAFFPASSQMPLGLAVCGLFAGTLLCFPPYLRKGDDRLHLLAIFEIYLTILAAFILSSRYSVLEAGGHTGDEPLEPSVDIALSLLFIGITILFTLAFIYLAVQSLYRMFKGWKFTSVADTLRAVFGRPTPATEAERARLSAEQEKLDESLMDPLELLDKDDPFGSNALGLRRETVAFGEEPSTNRKAARAAAGTSGMVRMLAPGHIRHTSRGQLVATGTGPQNGVRFVNPLFGVQLPEDVAPDVRGGRGRHYSNAPTTKAASASEYNDADAHVKAL